MRHALLFFISLLLCAPTWAEGDPHSYAHPREARVKHLDLDITVDFESRRVAGTATWDIQRAMRSDQIVFDTRHMEITSVVDGAGKPLPFALGKSDPTLGTPLTVTLPEGVDRLTIAYATRPEAAALQWLSPEQTAGGQEPFLFTQSQAILARTWIPCQDSPAVRFTYDARVKVPKHLMALMSASNPTELRSDGVYKFEMPQAIPSYLMAMAVGDVRFRALGPRTGIYAEPVMLEKSAWEFAETEKMVEAVEEMYGPYRWGRFDMLMLPPSFPFGGMENPRLTFLTPTVIAGDRSLTSLIAHELAHSWSGNLVTNSTWNDFWLNEGFTVFLERRIMESLYGAEYAAMLRDLGFDDLKRALKHYAPEDTHLKYRLTGRDPDLGVTDIAYEKGYTFLAYLEGQVGRERFDQFLKEYFDEHAFGSMDTEGFLEIVKEKLGPDIEVDAWVYGPGIPEGFTVEPSSRFAAVDAALAGWLESGDLAQLKTEKWSTMEWMRFLRGLPRTLSAEQMAQLDAAFHLTQSGNSEILAQWLTSAIYAGYRPADTALENFLVQVGRRKFLEVLYGALLETEGGKDRARAIYQKARPNYHSVSVGTIDEMLGWPY